MGYDFGVVDFKIKCKGEEEANDLRKQLEERFKGYYLWFGGTECVTVSCRFDNPGYSITDEIEDLVDFIGSTHAITGGARLEDGSDVTYVSIIDGKVVYANNAWIEILPPDQINKLEDIADWILYYTPDQIQQLKEYAEKNFGAGHDN